MKVFDHLLGNIAILETDGSVLTSIARAADLPSKANLLAYTGIGLAADLCRDSMIRLEVVRQVLSTGQQVAVEFDAIEHTASFHLIGTPVQ